MKPRALLITLFAAMFSLAQESHPANADKSTSAFAAQTPKLGANDDQAALQALRDQFAHQPVFSDVKVDIEHGVAVLRGSVMAD